MTMKETLFRLLRRQWITPLEALEQAQCMSLSQRCSEFSRDGHRVLKRWVTLPSGKRVKMYRIGKAV